jgi:pimeloyl-ACP methyl ester carboxylesterase
MLKTRFLKVKLLKIALLILVSCVVAACQTFKLKSTVGTVSIHGLADKSEGLQRALLSFKYDNLQQHALFIHGKNSTFSKNGVVVMAHGFHPNPPMYGKLNSGESLRPGNYYRAWIEAYAKAGFNVLVPDYRGHNISEGYKYTHQANKHELPEQYYAKDALASLLALEKQLETEFQDVVIVGHSMGSPIAFWLGQQLKERVKLVSLWSSAKYKLGTNMFSPPFVIHHGKEDKVTPFENSEYYINNFGSSLISINQYNSDKHLITGQDFIQAIKIDVALINTIFSKENTDVSHSIRK